MHATPFSLPSVPPLVSHGTPPERRAIAVANAAALAAANPTAAEKITQRTLRSMSAAAALRTARP